MASNNTSNSYRTPLGRYMAETFIPKYSNNVMGLVYAGASILIIVVGLRGLGTVAGDLEIIPKFLLSPEGKIDPNWVMFALLLEFALLLTLAFVTFFTPEEENYGGGDAAELDVMSGHHHGSKKLDIPDFREEISKLKELTDEEKKIIESYLDEIERVSNRITQIQMKNVEALKTMQTTLAKSFKDTDVSSSK